MGSGGDASIPARVASGHSRAVQRLRWRFTELVAIAPRKIAEMPEAEGKGHGLDAVRAGQQSLAHEPQTSQPQVSVQAHAAIALNGVMQGADGHTEFPGEILAVDRLSEIV